MRLYAFATPDVVSPAASLISRPKRGHAPAGARRQNSTVSAGWTRVFEFLVDRYCSNESPKSLTIVAEVAAFAMGELSAALTR